MLVHALSVSIHPSWEREGKHTDTTPLLRVLLLQRRPHPRRVVAPQGTLQREHAAPEGFGVGGLGLASARAGGGGVLFGGGGRGSGRGQGEGASPGSGALFAVVMVRGSPLGLRLGLGFVGFSVEEGVGVAVRGAGGDGVEVEVWRGGSAGGGGGGGVAAGAGDVVMGHCVLFGDIVVVWILGRVWGRSRCGMQQQGVGLGGYILSPWRQGRVVCGCRRGTQQQRRMRWPEGTDGKGFLLLRDRQRQ